MRNWNARPLLLAAVAAALTLCAHPLSAAQRIRRDVPPDSFLWQRANSVPEFISQLEQNAVVRKNLARHFGVSERQLIEYLKRNLTVITIQKSGRYPVWGVTRTGKIYRSSSYFRKGWRAFGLKDGTVLFKWSCGNPMVAGLPRVPVPVAKVPPPVVPPPPVPIPPPAPVEAPETVAPVVQEPQEYVPPAPMYVSAPPLSADPATPVTERRPPPWPLFPLLIWGGGGGKPFTPIPEPASLTLLGVGALALGALGRMRRKPR